ncbi:Hypothetical predicted protein [Cloeon dipterum]|uniref:Uncharacterized protein n=1 Tax=Cloeon dipterum TaxID=197152 RepID=A0A8S1D4W9_9INSE|nr:Hypothetical predicted protein [Cloeon dipterum]
MEIFFKYHGLLGSMNRRSPRISNHENSTSKIHSLSVPQILSCMQLPGDPIWHPSMSDIGNIYVSIAAIEYTGLRICLKRIIDKQPLAALVEIASDFDRMRQTNVQLNKHDQLLSFYLVRCLLQLVDSVPERVMCNLLAGNNNLNPMLLASLRYAMQREVLASNTQWLPIFAMPPAEVFSLQFDWSSLNLESVPEMTHIFSRIKCRNGEYMFGQFINCMLFAVTRASTSKVPRRR